MNFRTLDLNLLRVFDAVMAERNLTRAAAKLAMTQPAASNALRRLRDAMGDELFVRAGYGVQPTPYAVAIWPALRDALAQLRAALEPGAFEPASARESFVVAMADATAAELIPPLVTIIEREAPGVSLRVLPLTTRDPRALLESSELDLAVGYFPVAITAISLAQMHEDTPPSFGHERVYSSDYVCVMRRGHPLTARELTLEAYCEAHHLLVSFSGRPYGFVDEALAALKRSRRIVITVNQFFTAGRVVANSDLLTVLPAHFLPATGFADELEVRPLPLAVLPASVEMLWHVRQDARPGHRWLRARLAASAGAHPGREGVAGAARA